MVLTTSPRGSENRPAAHHDNNLQTELDTLHLRCAVYTRPIVVGRILDAVGWNRDTNLSQARLLEPAAGTGEFVIEAARRLVASCRKHEVICSTAALSNRIKSFELHPAAAEQARSRLRSTLQAMGLHHRAASACAKAWIVNDDFLLADTIPEGYTHVVGNPPYMRWSKIPENLRATYVGHLSRDMIGGDLFLPFLDRALEQLRANGHCGFLCSDRWRFMAFAEAFRNKWLPLLDVVSEEALPANEAFSSDVNSYPTILIASKRTKRKLRSCRRSVVRDKTLEQLGYSVKVGPALGHTPAFVLQPDERDAEPELLYPWIDGSDISEGTVEWKGRRVIAMYRDDGRLVELNRYPKLAARLDRFVDKLQQRSIVRNGAVWYRTIDRIRAQDWARPKLVVPELARYPRLAIDLSGAIPSHGVYAIFAPDDKVEELYDKLRDGRLAQALAGISPKVNGGYLRCYKRFLSAIRLSDS